jgi:hypothetical protein
MMDTAMFARPLWTTVAIATLTSTPVGSAAAMSGAVMNACKAAIMQVVQGLPQSTAQSAFDAVSGVHDAPLGTCAGAALGAKLSALSDAIRKSPVAQRSECRQTLDLIKQRQDCESKKR